MSMRKIRLPDIIEGLRRASQDDRVRALVAKVGGGRIGLARMQEIREAVADFRASGKLTVAWAETFGEFTHGNLPYYLATAFDRIYLQPSGTLGLTGVAVEQLFLHDALAKIGVGFQSAKRYEYKTAADNLTERGFTGPAREAAERLAVSVVEQISAAIAERRGKTVEDARALLDRGPFLAADALAEGLVDALGYRDEVYEAVRKEAGQDAILQYVGRYQRAARAGPAGPPPAEPARALRRGDLRVRPDQAGAQQPGPGGRRRHGLGHGGGRAAVGAVGRAGPGRAAAGQQPGRFGRGVRHDLARGGQDPRGGQAGRGVDERRGRLRRVLHLDGGRRHRGPARHAHRVDRRDHGQAGVRGGPGAGRHHHRFGGRGRPGDACSRPRTRSREDEWDRINAWLDAIYRDFTAKAAAGRRMPVERMHELARGGSGPAPTPPRTGWSTSSAGWRPRPRSPAAGRACPPTRRCASSPG